MILRACIIAILLGWIALSVVGTVDSNMLAGFPKLTWPR